MKLENSANTYVDSGVNLRNRMSNIANHQPCIFDDFPTVMKVV